MAPKQIQTRFWKSLTFSDIRNLLATSPGAELPLISCIVPTRDRPALLRLAVEGFLAQKYPNRELVVIDDSEQPVEDIVRTVPGSKYIRCRRGLSIGAKRNLACAEATGEFIAHWDDDDWYGPERLERQARPLLDGIADLSGLIVRHILNLPEERFWTLDLELHRRMFVGDVHGGTLCFRKSMLVEGISYPEVNIAEDAGLIRKALNHKLRLARVDGINLYVYIRHRQNSWKFETGTFINPKGWISSSMPVGFTDELVNAYKKAMQNFSQTSNSEQGVSGSNSC